MANFEEVRKEVLNRIADISGQTVDHRYENPYDTALAVLLWLTSLTIPDSISFVADLVDRAPQCWYAKKLSQRLKTAPPVESGGAEDR